MKYKLHVRRYCRPFKKPLMTSRGTLRDREGFIIRLEDELNNVGFGEMAPMEFLGTHSLEDMAKFCYGLNEIIDDDFINGIDLKMGCCRFAFQSAQAMIRMSNRSIVDKEFEVAGLISLGDNVEDLILLGYKTFKCKIGKDHFKKEREAFLSLKNRLPKGALLRLDANGALSFEEAEDWLKLLEVEAPYVQFLEQPLPKGKEPLMKELGKNYRTPIALDESIINIKDLEQLLDNDWPGWLVIKPVLMGDLVRFRNLREKCTVPIIYSSVFETDIGMDAALGIAASDKRNNYALGFGTNAYFYEDGFNTYPVGPVIKSCLRRKNDLERIWELCEPLRNRKNCPIILSFLSQSQYQRSFEEACSRIRKDYNECKKRGILIATVNPVEFIGAFFMAVYFEIPLFLSNPRWKEVEWKQVFGQIRPAIVFGEVSYFTERLEDVTPNLKSFEQCIMIPTGGSGGKVRFAIHTWESLSASAKATARFLGKAVVNSLCLLPLYHVSGLMQVIRAAITNGEVLFDALESFCEKKDFKGFKGFCLSLVPTQLERFMEDSQLIDLLRTFDAIFLGGAPASEMLLEKAKIENLPIAPTYGMTETASMVTAMLPEHFLNGMKGVGKALSHTLLSINNQNEERIGRICIHGQSLFKGYFPELPCEKATWVTNDEGFIDEEGYLTVIGRADRIIITGGEKVDPKEVETAILKTGLVKAVMVSSREDKEWGRRVIAICVAKEEREGIAEETRWRLKEILLNYKIPKEFIMVDKLPIDEKGKIVRTKLLIFETSVL